MNPKDNYPEYIKNWIRPLQKSLTLETESQYVNILGKAKYFNEYIYDNFNNLDHLNLNDEFTEILNKFATSFYKYNTLEITQRKRLIIDTRKFLFKLSKSFESNFIESKESIKYHLQTSRLVLNSDLGKIKGVGKVLKDNLNKLGLYSVVDLIEYFPRTYLDYSNKENIINLRPDNLYTCKGTIKRFYMYKSGKNKNLSIMNIVIYDSTSSIRVTKFFVGKRFRTYSFFSNQKDKYKPGLKIAISGKVKLTEYGRSFVDPQIEILNYSDDSNFTGKILPIYPLFDSISNISFINIIKQILYCANSYPDLLNDKQIKRLSLIPINEALINIHLPSSKSVLDQSKKRIVFDELLLLQLKFLLKKNAKRNISLESNKKDKRVLLDNFLLNLPFKLTKSQGQVLDEIKSDLMDSSPMARLLQGDVGSGKTIIAIASLLYIVEKGYQGALMVPTEVLADQHYKNLLKNINPIQVSVEILTGNTSKKNRRRILTDLLNGQIDILIGTHALFEEKVVFKSLGLVVIDEQHRFGVSQRNRLLKKGENAHLLSMTATPIPRTLALSIYGDLDISKITELPPGRIPITTQIVSEDNLSNLFKKIEGEIYNGKQIFVILPLIEDSEKLNLNSAKKIFEYLSKEVFKQFNVGLLHGKLNAQDKNKIIDLFKQNKVNILVSTTVIEVGIDVPNASIMLIYNSERFGLSQLHQLRGRVGRGANKSFCYLLTSENNVVKNKRLEVLQKSNDGFYIAEKDLDLRGPGQILGYKQSGLPDFVLQNLPQNKILIDKARKEASFIISKDPQFKNNVQLKNILLNKLENKFIHEFLN